MRDIDVSPKKIGRPRRTTRKLLRTFYRPWYRRAGGWLLVGLPVLAIARLLLSPAVELAANAELRGMEGNHAVMRDVDVSVFPPTYTLEGLKVSRGGDPAQRPLLAVPHMQATFSWSGLLVGDRGAHLRVDGPRWTADGQPLTTMLENAFERLGGTRPERILIDAGEIYLPDAPFAWVTRLRATVQHNTQSVTTIEGQGALLGDGELAFRVTSKSGPTTHYDGEIAVRNLPLVALEAYGVRAAGPPPVGTAEFRGRFKVRGREVWASVVPGQGSTALASSQLAPLVSGIRRTFATAAPEVDLQVRSDLAGEAGAVLHGLLPAGDGCPASRLVGVLRALLVEGLATALKRPPQKQLTTCANASCT